MYVNDWRILMVILVFTFSFITSLFPRLLPPNSMLFLNFCFDTFCIFRHLYTQPFPSLILPFLRLQERERERARGLSISSVFAIHSIKPSRTSSQNFVNNFFWLCLLFQNRSLPPPPSLRPRHVLLALHSAKF